MNRFGRAPVACQPKSTRLHEPRASRDFQTHNECPLAPEQTLTSRLQHLLAQEPPCRRVDATRVAEPRSLQPTPWRHHPGSFAFCYCTSITIARYYERTVH